MVIGSSGWDGKADRAFARPARHNRQLNVSIRADLGESSKYTVDRSRWEAILVAIELPVIGMSNGEILKAVILHKEKRAGCDARWFAGVRVAHRLHPWDEQGLSFPTAAWLDCVADAGEPAQGVVQALFSMGYEKSPLHSESPTAKHVFVYSLNMNSLN